MNKQPTRIFTLGDDHVIVHTGVIKNRYEKHAASFTDFNNVKFHTEYHNHLAQLINDAKNTLSDGFILKSQARETAEVKDISDQLEKSLKKLSFNVKSCFIDDPKIINEFRLNRISEFSKNPDRFIGFTKDVLVMVDKYKGDLLKEGLKEETLMIISAQQEELDLQRREQIEAIQSRPVHTRERIDTMNNLWKHLVELRDASDIVFDGQEEIRVLFELPKSTVRSSDGHIEFGDVIANLDEV